MENIKIWLKPLLEEMGCTLYGLEWDRKMNPPVLRIMIDRTDGQPVDLELCSQVSQKISEKLDQLDDGDENYILEVCSAGVDRPIKNEEQLMGALDQYIHVDLLKPVDGIHFLEGTLSQVNPDSIQLSYFVKGRPKKKLIDRKDIKEIRHAIKL